MCFMAYKKLASCELFMNRIFIALIVALILACIFHQDVLLQHFTAPADKVAAPMQSSRTKFGDHYYYYILAKKAVLKLNPFVDDNAKQEQSFFYQNSGQENVYSGALLVAGLFDYIAHLLPIDWNMQTLIAFIFQTSFLFFSSLLVYIRLRDSKSVSWIELLIFGFLLAYYSRGVIYGVYAGSLTYPFTESPFYYPDFLRLVNPQITWAFALFYLTFLLSFFKKSDYKIYFLLIILSLCFGIFSIPLTVTMILGVGLYGIAILCNERKIDYYLLGLGVALICSFLYVRYQMDLFYSTEKGQNLQTGSLTDFKIKIHYFYLLIFLPLIRKFLPLEAKSPLTWLYVASIILGSICDSFALGSRIWLRGSAIFFHVLIIYALFELCRMVLSKYWDKFCSSNVLQLAILSLIITIVYVSLKPSNTGWYGYIEKDKAEVIEWFRINASRKDVIASPNLEDAYYIPQYTNSQPYVQLFDFSPLSFQELMRHYFQTLDLFGAQDRYLEKILTLEKKQLSLVSGQIESKPVQRVSYDDYQIYSFYAALIYYPYNKSIENIFLTPESNEEFHDRLMKVAAESKAANVGKIDFIIFEKNTGIHKPQGYLTRFENAQYEILSKN